MKISFTVVRNIIITYVLFIIIIGFFSQLPNLDNRVKVVCPTNDSDKQKRETNAALYEKKSNDNSNILINTNDRMANQTHWCVLSKAFMPIRNSGRDLDNNQFRSAFRGAHRRNRGSPQQKQDQGNSKKVNNNKNEERPKKDAFDHFPHCMEVVLPCWSWFRSQNAENNCGFVLLDGLRFDQHGNNNNTWQSQLVSHMGCSVRYGSRPPATAPGGIVQHTPNLKFMKPRFGYRRYLSNSEDAQALRRLVIPDHIVHKHKSSWMGDNSDTTYTLNIGLIQRRENRVITNLRDIQAAIEQALPNAIVSFTHFDYPQIQDQALWFATKDVIICAHGAVLTNSIFIAKGTFVLQLYPPGFHWQSMDPLIEQSGGIALDWYEGIGRGDDPMEKFYEAKKDFRTKNAAQHGNFTAPVREVLEILLVALGKKVPTIKMVENHIW